MSNKYLLLAIKFFLYTALLMPLFVGLRTFTFPFIVPKILFFRIIVELAFVLYLFLIWRNKSFLPRKNLLLYLTSLFMLIIFLSAVFGVDWQNSWWGNFERMEGVFTILHVYLYFILLGSILREKKDWQRFFNILLAVSATVIFTGLIQRFASAGKPFITLGSTNRVFGTLGNYIYFGQYSFFTFWLAALSWHWCQWKHRAWLYSSIMILAVVGLFLAASRGPILAWLISLIFFGVAYVYFSQNKKYKLIFTAISVLLVLFLMIVVFIPNNFTAKLPGIQGLSEIYTRGGTASTRLMAWEIARKGFLEKPVLGWGWFNYYVVFNKFYNPKFLEHGWGETWFDQAHNQYFDILATTGMVGLAAYLSIYIGLVYLLIRLYKQKKIDWQMFLICLSLLLSHFVNNIFVFEHPSSYMLFFSLLAFVGWLTSEQPSQQALSGVAEARGHGPRRVIMVLLLLSAIYFFYYGNVLAYQTSRQDRNLQVAFQADPVKTAPDMSALAGRSTPHQRDLRNDFARAISYLQRPEADLSAGQIYKEIIWQGIRMLEDNARAYPLDARVKLSLAQMYKDLYFAGEDQRERMEEIFQDLRNLSPRRQQVYYYWAELKLLNDDYEGALALVERTIQDDSEVWQGYWFLAKIEGLRSNWPEAKKYLDLAKAKGFDPDSDQQVLVEIIEQQN